MVDASVAAKWVVAEPHSDQAAALLAYDTLYAPDHWQAEAVNVIWSKVHLHDLTPEDAERKVDHLLRAPIIGVPVSTLIKRAFGISVRNGVTVYDALYIALAQERGTPFVTADVKLLRKITDDSLRPLLRWIGDLPVPN